MKFRRHAVGALLFMVALTITVSTLVASTLFSSLTTDVEAGQFELMQATVESKISNTEGRAASRAQMVADLPSVRRLLAARDRDGLNAELHAMWTTQHEQYGASMAQFHVAPAVSFLRLHHPEQFGDDLSTYRPMVVAVNQDHAPRRGATISRSGPSVVACVPVVGPDGSPAGSFEMGLDYGPMLDDLNESFDLVSTLFVLEAPLREVATSMDPSVYDDANRVGSHVKFYSTNWELTRQLVQAADLTAVDAPVRYTREAAGVPYGVLLYPVRNVAGDAMGVIAVARDFSATRAAAGRSRVWQALIALFGIVLLWGVILVVVRGMLLRPAAMLAERFAELAKGDRSKPVGDRDAMPEELGALADAHEALRTNGIPGSGEAAWGADDGKGSA
jgi:methyl-accepting chemotaxis protein